MGGFSVIFFCSFLSTLIVSDAVDIVSANQKVGFGETIISSGGIYELGFFSHGKAQKWYLGIWYKKISTGTVVWVANRDIPLSDSLGVLKITNPGNLVLLNSSGSIIWSSNSSRSVRNPVAQLLDTGNLIVRDASDSKSEHFLWQSFDYPSDTFLPGMKLGRNLVSGLDRHLTSWKSTDDPSQGNFTYGLDPSGYPQMILRNGTVVQFRSGPWNGLRFSGYPELRPNPIYTYGFVFNQEEVYFYYELVNSSVVSRKVLKANGLAQRLIWVDRTQGWIIYSSAQMDNCDSYALCGGYGSCNINRSPQCWCVNGFVPKFPKDWDMADWSNGCARRTPLDCPRDGFVKYSGVKVPDTRYSWFNESMNLQECQMVCLKNCSCTAYTNLDIRGEGSGCLLWFGDLIDIREFNENGQDLYIRMAASEIDGHVTSYEGSRSKKRERVIAASVISVGLLLLGLALVLFVCKRKQKKEGKTEPSRVYSNESRKEELESPLFDFATIANATGNFSDDNKLGEGGFGPVYKGILMEGQEIAVKRLSKYSRQGLDEFKNEVVYIAKLQHRNLVKLLGCCIQVEEKMLIYEYMPNKSLNYFLFDRKSSMLLDWPKRFNIINGIARGLLYLHQDSILRIVHRDLKADNVLLDNEMNPKISDFGLARSFRGNETEANTNKVVGTHGYISPEYAVNGLYSIKSDIFSFGVLVLEILSGRRNRGFYHPDHDLNLLGHAWQLYTEGRSLEMIDASIRASWRECEVLRSIHVGLLCVQQCPEDRPSMSTVALMLGGEGVMPRPKPPGFFTGRSPHEAESSSSKDKAGSTNEVTITQMEAR